MPSMLDILMSARMRASPQRKDYLSLAMQMLGGVGQMGQGVGRIPMEGGEGGGGEGADDAGATSSGTSASTSTGAVANMISPLDMFKQALWRAQMHPMTGGFRPLGMPPMGRMA